MTVKLTSPQAELLAVLKRLKSLRVHNMTPAQRMSIGGLIRHGLAAAETEPQGLVITPKGEDW